jgi:hypothetical protein
MMRHIETHATPHGHVVVWESRYPEDVGAKFRYVVTLEGRLRRSVREAFERDGFFASIGLTRAEAIAEARKLATLSQRTQSAIDEIHRQMLVDRFRKFASIWD